MRVNPSNYRDTRRSVPDRMDETNPRATYESRNTFRTILTLAIFISIIFGILMVIYIVRQNSNANSAKEDSSAEKENAYEKKILDDCIDNILENILRENFNQSNPNHLQPIRIKAFITLRRLSPTYKRDLILFLYEKELIRTDIPLEQRLDLQGADLNNIQFKNITLDYLYLPGVMASNSRFSTCRLKKSNFQGSIMDHSRFIGCVLEESTFSGASLKHSSFAKDHILSSIDFTNTDLLGSDININGNNNILVNTRLSDGSFSQIDTKQLISDGGAEQQCNTSHINHLWTEPEHSSLEIADRQNNSCWPMETIDGNNCYFQVKDDSRYIQDIDLNRYSILIDNNRAWYNVSGHLGCANTSQNDWATIELRFANKHRDYNSNQTHAIKSKTFELLSNSSLIPIGMRSVRIMIGANIHNSEGGTPSCCAIDDVSFHIFEHNEKNLTT